MYKHYIVLPLLLIGCTTMNNDPTLSQRLQQRDSLAMATNGFQLTLSQRLQRNDSLAHMPDGFSSAEAQQLLEFCIELNNQDDRNNPLKNTNPTYLSKALDWTIVFDSRHPGNHEWNKIWPYDPADEHLKDPNNPETNGFGPLNNAWLLVQSLNDPSVFAIAIRGTVGEWRSILADAYASSIPAYAGLEYPKNNSLPITFAATPKAQIHLGFSYASLALLFEDNLGILTQIQKISQQQKISKLYITGHSQGAAIATLIHSFLYYASTDRRDRYSLKSKLSPAQLKSYLFAQPKPGNLQYAQDFARISKDSAYVINNDRDPVPQLPLSLESISEVARYIEEDNENIAIGSWFNQLAESISQSKNEFKDKLAHLFTQQVADKFKTANIGKSINTYFPASNERPFISLADSLNYTMAGQLVPIFGVEKGGELYPIGSSPDSLLQHHATSYRLLIEQELVKP